MAMAVDTADMSRPRPDTLNAQDPTPRSQTDEAKPEPATESDDDRIVFSAWDCALVPPLKR